MNDAPERYDITRRFLSQTVGRTISAVRIPNKWAESSWKPTQSKDAPGNSLVRLSPSRMMNSTQYDCIQVPKWGKYDFSRCKMNNRTCTTGIHHTYIQLRVQKNLHTRCKGNPLSEEIPNYMIHSTTSVFPLSFQEHLWWTT